MNNKPLSRPEIMRDFMTPSVFPNEEEEEDGAEAEM
jgi:hypothetical protein